MDTNGRARPEATIDWPFIGRVVLKAALLFVLLNALFAACRPLDVLGRLSLYNVLWPGRDRLPYGEIPTEDYNLTLSNLPAMVASHAVSRPKAADEFRVLVLGDSGTWGWFLENDNTLAGQLNRLDLSAADGRRVVAYNLGYPIMSLTKDLLILNETIDAAEPDLIIWPVTMQSFARGRQLDHPLLLQNGARVESLMVDYDLTLPGADEKLVERTFLEETIVSRRRELADLLRLQGYGLAWAATRKDQAIPAEVPLRKNDLDPDTSWLDVPEERRLTSQDLSFDVLWATTERAGGVPVLVVNEPIFVADGANSDLRYNSFYPRWAYDQYREMLAGAAAEPAAQGRWRYLDLWDAVPPGEFTDTPVHLTPEGTRLMAERVAEMLVSLSE
jgi:hypothetical protein